VNKGLSSNYHINSNGNFSNVKGKTAYIVLQLSGGNGGAALCNYSVNATDPTGSGAYFRQLKFYRQADESDLNAGFVFRRAYKQYLVNLCPSAIRFMNWVGPQSGTLCRFENRTLPSNAGYGIATDWVSSPAYGKTTGTNLYSLAAASPTTSNPKTTPTSMTHGEIATCLLVNASVRGGSYSITSITSGGLVTTSSAHGYANGDWIWHSVVGLPGLNCFPVQISSVTTNTYNVPSSTTSSGTFVSGYTAQYFSLNVNSRGIFPMTNIDGFTPWNSYFNLNANNYYTFCFDKNCAAITDGTFANFTGSISGTTLTVSSVTTGVLVAGQTLGDATGNLAGATKLVNRIDATRWSVTSSNNSQNVSSETMTATGWIYGTWICNINNGGNLGQVPLEIMTALINEVNALAVSQGVNQPIHMWLNLPTRALNTLDPDYSFGSDWGLNAVDTVLSGANGYSGLTGKAQLFIEVFNEPWNPGFFATNYLQKRGGLRWPASGNTQPVDMQLLLSTNVVRSIKANYPTSRIKCILGGWGDVGVGKAPGAFGANYERINGNPSLGAGYFYTSQLPSSAWGAPMTNYDCFATATYNNPNTIYCQTRTGIGTFTDDSAMFNGTNNSKNGGGNYTGAANPTQACANFAVACTHSTQIPADGVFDKYLAPSLTGYTANFAAAVRPYGKVAINYEGGTNWDVAVGVNFYGTGHLITLADSAFLIAAIGSSAYAVATITYFNNTALVPNSAMPSVYLFIANPQRWAYAAPDTYADNSGGTQTEGQQLLNSATWVAMGARNQGLSI
jgi:hypothetical protein